MTIWMRNERFLKMLRNSRMKFLDTVWVCSTVSSFVPKKTISQGRAKNMPNSTDIVT